MFTASTYRRIGAWVFILLFTTSWSLKMGHVFLKHHDHKHLSCTVPQDGGAHIHDERYKGDDCTICAFVLSIPELPPVFIFSDVLPPVVSTKASFHAIDAPHPAIQHGLFLRGPPAGGRNLFRS